jgi:hypothetical protein
MVIFHSYVKLPEGISHSTSLLFGCKLHQLLSGAPEVSMTPSPRLNQVLTSWQPTKTGPDPAIFQMDFPLPWLIDVHWMGNHLS